MGDKSLTFSIAHILTRIDEEQLVQFAEEKLEIGGSDLKYIETACSSRKRELTVDKWMETETIADPCRTLHQLIYEYEPKRIKVDPDRMYSLKRKQGCALIIVNSFMWSDAESKDSPNRGTAAENDLRLMKNLWADTLGCKLFGDTLHKDQTAEQMDTLLQKFSTIKEKYDYVVVVISTHGGLVPEKMLSIYEGGNSNEGNPSQRPAMPMPDKNQSSESNEASDSGYSPSDASEDNRERSVSDVSQGPQVSQRSQISPVSDNVEERGQIFAKNQRAFKNSFKQYQAKGKKSTTEVFLGDDHIPVREQKIKKYFYNDQTSPSLYGIPKFFILDYCRGASECNVVRKKSKTTGFGGEKENKGGDGEKYLAASALPAVSDVLIAYATHPEFVAFERKSSWLICIIHDVFMKYYKEEHAVTMLTMVNGWMKNVQQTDQAMSVFESSLGKELYFKG